MLLKMCLKLLLKAMVPLIAVAGMMTYGLYLKGGDPMKMWSKIGNGMLGSMRQSGQRTAESVQALNPVGDGPRRTQVFSWVDAHGTTHYGSNPPAGVTARSMSINTTSNVVAPPPKPAQPVQTSMGAGSSNDSGFDGALPGVAGQDFPINIKPEDLGMTQEELFKMLQSHGVQ